MQIVVTTIYATSVVVIAGLVGIQRFFRMDTSLRWYDKKAADSLY